MNRIIKTAVIAAIAGVGIIGTAGAASAGDNVPYSGQGASAAGIPNNQPTPANDGGTGQFAKWGDENNTYDAGEGYLVWLLSANGATSATINLPDGPREMTKFGSSFKYVTDFIPKDQQNQVYASYIGTAKGKVVLTISHGSVVFDTNIPSGVHWDQTTGGTVPASDAIGDNPVFGYKQTQDRNYSWQCSDDHVHTSVQHLVFNWKVDATPIYGNNTDALVGWQLTGTTTKLEGQNYRTGPAERSCPDGGSFVQWVMGDPSDPNAVWTPQQFNIPFTNNIASGLIVNGTWLPNTV